ncbi:MAG TPA: M90 family metallopeptidase [Burkholderiales bacterium]|nr:M90 family metallopeptidase [Burkholderiales bacterium]
MFEALRNWRRDRVLKRSPIDDRMWRQLVARYPFTRTLPDADRARLRDLTVLFLHEKSIVGAGGLEVRDEMRMGIAVQACMLILNLGLDWYRGWVEVIVYPDEFVAEYEYMDEAGVSHHVEQPMTGESWHAGPVILSWADAEQRGGETGYNVVIHEFAHKLDMLNGDANGFPPLHADMERDAWSRIFGEAYEDFSRRAERDEETGLDPYGAESPAEFFAVLSEAFFETPRAVQAAYGDVYRQLAAFYRQDPAARLGRRARSTAQ